MDYSEGKIYKLVDNTNNNIYIGSDTKSSISTTTKSIN
mgnify:CR=1 FL=1